LRLISQLSNAVNASAHATSNSATSASLKLNGSISKTAAATKAGINGKGDEAATLNRLNQIAGLNLICKASGKSTPLSD